MLSMPSHRRPLRHRLRNGPFLFLQTRSTPRIPTPLMINELHMIYDPEPIVLDTQIQSPAAAAASVWAELEAMFKELSLTSDEQNERRQIRQQIEATSTAKLAPPLNETELIQSLVLQFLTHDGYIETARAFADEITSEKKALSLDPTVVIPVFDVKEDEDAGRRQRKLNPTRIGL